MGEKTGIAFVTPWEPTPDDIAKYDYGADYIAWERWMCAQASRSEVMNFEAEWEQTDGMVRSFLYSAMCEVALHAQKSAGAGRA